MPWALLGGGIFGIALIIAMFFYIGTKKWYPILYIISISLYIFTVPFGIDAFNISKNGIILILAFSSLLAIGLGLYLSKKFKDMELEFKRLRVSSGWLVPVIIIIILLLLFLFFLVTAFSGFFW